MSLPPLRIEAITTEAAAARREDRLGNSRTLRQTRTGAPVVTRCRVGLSHHQGGAWRRRSRRCVRCRALSGARGMRPGGRSPRAARPANDRAGVTRPRSVWTTNASSAMTRPAAARFLTGPTSHRPWPEPSPTCRCIVASAQLFRPQSPRCAPFASRTTFRWQPMSRCSGLGPRQSHRSRECVRS